MYVTNNWEKPIVFDYAFQQYRFPVNQTVEAPEEAIRHIFGWGDNDKEVYLTRLGLIKTKNDLPQGLEILEKIQITLEPPQQNHSLSPVMERVPLPSSKKAGGNVLA